MKSRNVSTIRRQLADKLVCLLGAALLVMQGGCVGHGGPPGLPGLPPPPGLPRLPGLPSLTKPTNEGLAIQSGSTNRGFSKTDSEPAPQTQVHDRLTITGSEE